MPSSLFGLSVHFADPHIVVVEKPAGVVMHPGHPRPQVSLKEMLRREGLAAGAAPAMAHRLDRGTSGLVVFALTPEAARHLGRQFEDRGVEKGYRAIVAGRVGAEAGGIDLPLGPVEGSGRPARQRIGGSGARPARTCFAVVARGPAYTLLDLIPDTGRRHQLRVHLAALGHPIVGDGLYGAREPVPGLEAGRHALHASALAFVHPENGERMAFTSPLPTDLAALWGEAGVAVPEVPTLAWRRESAYDLARAGA